MKQPLQAILIAGEEAKRAVINHIKRITIREGHRNYIVGKPVILCCHLLNWAARRRVVSVTHTYVKDVSEQDFIEDFAHDIYSKYSEATVLDSTIQDYNIIDSK